MDFETGSGERSGKIGQQLAGCGLIGVKEAVDEDNVRGVRAGTHVVILAKCIRSSFQPCMTRTKVLHPYLGRAA